MPSEHTYIATQKRYCVIKYHLEKSKRVGQRLCIVQITPFHGKSNFPFRFPFVHSLQDYSKEAVAFVQKYLMKNEVPVNLFEPYIDEIFNHLRGEPFRKYLER